jgi:hypothetical protein
MRETRSEAQLDEDVITGMLCDEMPGCFDALVTVRKSSGKMF